MEVFGILFFLCLTVLFGMLVYAIACFFPRFRRCSLLSFVAPPSAFFLWVFIKTILFNHACGPMLAFGPRGGQSFEYCIAMWPRFAFFPLWLLSTAVVWCVTFLVQCWLNRKCSLVTSENRSEETTKVTNPDM
jgi:hypothetical protein